MEPIRIAYQSYTSEHQAGSYWKHLQEHINKITDEGAIPLIESPNFPALKILDIGKNLLGEASALAAFRVNRKEKVRVIYR